MIMSMTGFSSSTISVPINADGSRINLTLTLKTLNSKFFEVNCKLPYAFTHLETDLIKNFKSKLYRGNIYFTLYMTNPHALTVLVDPSKDSISGYLRTINKIKEEFNLGGNITINDIINLPYIFETQEKQLSESSTELIFKAVDELVAKLVEYRIKEGMVLSTDILTRIENILKHFAELETRATEFMNIKKESIILNIKTILEENSPEAFSEAQNMVIFNQLDKIDIHEEIVRFKAHLNNLCTIIKSNDIEKGKKIDFTLQELFREINTMTAKCCDAVISGLAINIKVELEKAREQAQNII